jgi:hypothetical protein
MGFKNGSFFTLVNDMQAYATYLKEKQLKTDSFKYDELSIRFMANQQELEKIIKCTRNYIDELALEWRLI